MRECGGAPGKQNSVTGMRQLSRHHCCGDFPSDQHARMCLETAGGQMAKVEVW